MRDALRHSPRFAFLGTATLKRGDSPSEPGHQLLFHMVHSATHLDIFKSYFPYDLASDAEVTISGGAKTMGLVKEHQGRRLGMVSFTPYVHRLVSGTGGVDFCHIRRAEHACRRRQSNSTPLTRQIAAQFTLRGRAGHSDASLSAQVQRQGGAMARQQGSRRRRAHLEKGDVC